MDYGNKYEDFRKWCIIQREDLFDIMGTEFLGLVGLRNDERLVRISKPNRVNLAQGCSFV